MDKKYNCITGDFALCQPLIIISPDDYVENEKCVSCSEYFQMEKRFYISYYKSQ